MPTRWTLNNEATVVDLVRHTRSTSTTPVVSTVGALDTRLYPGSRFLLMLSAFETNVSNTGGTWAVEDSATSGGTYAAVATQDGDSLAVAADLTTIQTRKRSFLPNPARPFVRVTWTGTDSSQAMDVTAFCIVLRRAMV